MQSSSTIHSQLIVSRKLLWWNLKKSYTRRYMRHLDHHERFPTRDIECVIWILISLEAAKISNESNQNPIIKYGETRMCTRIHPALRVDTYTSVGGRVRQGGGARHWLQRTRIATCSCERSRTSPSSRARQKRSKVILFEKHFHADLQQNNVVNPFSKNSKEMIRELGNVELFELCETIPNVQCSHCLLYWNQRDVYCTCGQFLLDSESRRKFNKLRLYVLSIPTYVIKKGLNHGAQYGKTKEQTEYHMTWNAWKRCCKKVDSQGEYFTGIHDRFLGDPVYHESQLAIGWTQQKCKEWDELRQEGHTHRPTPEEKRRYQGQGYLTLNGAGISGPMKLRSHFRAGISTKNRLHHESGNKLKSLSIQFNTVDGIPLQAHRGGQLWMELEMSS